MSKSSLKEKKVDSTELAKALKVISEADRIKIYYMIKGIELVNEPTLKVG